MRMTVLFLFFVSTVTAQSSVEIKVLENVREMMSRSGRVVFSELYNDSRFSAEEKEFLGRLYEIFFQIPGYCKTELQNTGRIPLRQDIASSFGISRGSVDLLLQVMTADPRVPRLFTRNPQTQEIDSLNLQNIDAFVRQRGSQVRVTQWQGKPLPSFELDAFDGGKIGSAELAGKNVLIYFWFTGCPPCERIAPLLAELHSQYSISNFAVLGFNADRILGLPTSDGERLSHLKKHGVGFVNAHLDKKVREAFGNVGVFPTLFFVKSDGTIWRNVINYQDRSTLEKLISELTAASRE